jgi:hypothetical protein
MSMDCAILIGFRFLNSPSRVIPGFRGTPAGITTTSAPERAALRPDGVGSYPVTVLSVLTWLISAATPVITFVSIFCLIS